MKKNLTTLVAAALLAAVSLTSKPAQARWEGNWSWGSGAFASPHYYYVPFYYAPYGFRYVGNPDYPGCYFARRAGPHGSYVVPVC